MNAFDAIPIMERIRTAKVEQIDLASSRIINLMNPRTDSAAQKLLVTSLQQARVLLHEELGAIDYALSLMVKAKVQ